MSKFFNAMFKVAIIVKISEKQKVAQNQPHRNRSSNQQKKTGTALSRRFS